MGYQPADVFAALGSELPEEALFTTFTFSPSTFQHEYLIPLLHRGCPEIAVLVDSIGYAQSLFSAATVQSIGTEYRLRQVPLSGAFHGKLVIVRTRHSVLLGVGSGNITSPGLQTNAEVGGLYRLEGAAQRDAVQRLISRLRPMGMLEGPTAEAVGPIALTDGARLLTSMDSPIFDQLDPPPDVERIEIVSPFVDDKLEVVLALRTRWPRAHIRLRMDPGFGALSDSLLTLVGDRMTVLVPSEPHGETSRRPPVHGKLMCFIGRKTATVVLGSANLSRPALLSLKNFEAVVERRMPTDAVDALLSVPHVGWRKAKADDRRAFGPVTPQGASGIVIASLHFRSLGVSWSAHHGGTGVAKIWCRGRCITEKRFADAPDSGGRRVLDWELGADVCEAFSDPCYAELKLKEGQVLRGWIEVSDRLGMTHEAKRQLIFLDAIASDPLNCKEADVVKFIELLQRRLDYANRHHAGAGGGVPRSPEDKQGYDDIPVDRRLLLETGANHFGHFFALEHLVNRSLDAALRDIRFFGRDRVERAARGKRTGAAADEAAEDDDSATMTRASVPLRIETVLARLFDQLSEAFDSAGSPQAVARLIAQVPGCLKGLAYAAERWLSPTERHALLHRYFRRAVVACLAPGIGSIAKRDGAVRRLPVEARKDVAGGPEFELGLATLEAYLLVDHAGQPPGTGSFGRDMYDVLRELPAPSREAIEIAGEEVKRMLPPTESVDAATVESLRAAMEAATGQLATLRRSRAALKEVVSRIRSGFRDREALRPLAKDAVGEKNAEDILKAFIGYGARLRLEEIGSDKVSCPSCHTSLAIAPRSRLNDASHVERCFCGVFLVRSLEK